MSKFKHKKFLPILIFILFFLICILIFILNNKTNYSATSPVPTQNTTVCDVSEEQAVLIVNNLPEIKEQYSELLNNNSGFIYAKKPNLNFVKYKNTFWEVSIGEKGDDWSSTKKIIYLDKCGNFIGEYKTSSQ